MSLTALRTELLLPAYAGMTDAQAAASLNTANRQKIAPTLASTLVRQIIAAQSAEYAALTEASRAMLTYLTQGGSVDIANASIRAVLLAMFPANSATRAALTAAAVTLITRAQELSLPAPTAVQVGWARNQLEAFDALGATVAARATRNEARLAACESDLTPVPTLAQLDAE